MLRIKCKNCGRLSEVYENEKELYLKGWYYSDGRRYPNTGHAIEICEKCQSKEVEFRKSAATQNNR